MQNIHEKVFSLVQIETKTTTQILEHLLVVDGKQLYLEKGYRSLIEYCIKFLKYSEGSAKRRVDSMRLIRKVPSAKKQIEQGELSFTNASQAWSFLQNEKDANPKDVVSQILGKTTREAEKTLIDLSAPDSKFRRKSKLRRATSNDWDLTVTITDETQKKLSRIRDIRSHSSKSWEDVIDFMAEVALKELTKERKPKEETTGRCATSAGRAYYLKKANYKCQHPGCTATAFLQVDHIHAYSKGGKTVRGNLQVLCAAHNRFKGAR